MARGAQITAPLDLDALERAAQDCPAIGDDRIVVDFQLLEKLRAFHMAANPAVVLELVRRLRAAEGTIRADDDRLQSAGERVGVIAGCDTADWMADEIERLRAESVGLQSMLAESRANDMQAMRWLAECREASGDNGLRMLPEFVEYLRELRQAAGRYEKVSKMTPLDFQLLFHRNIKGVGSFDDLVDALVQD